MFSYLSRSNKNLNEVLVNGLFVMNEALRSAFSNAVRAERVESVLTSSCE